MIAHVFILPKPAICIIDDNRDTRGDVSRHVRRTIPNAKVLGFSSSIELHKKTTDRKIEPCVLVADSVGTGFLASFRSEFKRTKVIIFSRQTQLKDAAGMWHQQMIDSYVSKPHIDELVSRVSQHFHSYWDQSWLRTMRDFIERCEDPHVPYYPSLDGRRYLSILEVYWEAVRGTELGCEAIEAWGKMIAVRAAIRRQQVTVKKSPPNFSAEIQ